jgi:prolipoprotein diacylglyceryltransferase
MKGIIIGIIIFIIIAFIYEDAIELAGKLLGVYVVVMGVISLFSSSSKNDN